MSNSLPFAPLSWRGLASLAAAYTFCVFTCYGFKSGMVFSKRNTTPRSTILLTHANFVLALVAVMWLATAISPHLPEWTTQKWIPSLRMRGRGSIAEAIFIAALMGMAYFEHQLIYREAETSEEQPR